jgi:hypothetical protein
MGDQTAAVVHINLPFSVARLGRGPVGKRDNSKLDRYLNRNKPLPVLPPVRLEYSSLPPPRRAIWRMTLDVLFGAGARLGIACAFVGAAAAIGLWQRPTALVGILLVIFSIVSVLVLIALLRR